MGGLCSKRSAVDKSPSDSTLHADGLRDHEPKSYQYRTKARSGSTLPTGETMDKQFPEQPFSFSERTMLASGSIPDDAAESREPQLSRTLSDKSRPAKSKPAASAKAGTTKVSPSLGS